MSQKAPRGSKKLENIANQLKIGKYAHESRQSSTSSERPNISKKTEKRRRRSTGERSASKQQTKEVLQKTAIGTMITTSSNATMLQEMKGMEQRLTASMKESRDEELQKMEERIKANMKSIVDSSINAAIQQLNNSISTVVDSNPTISAHTTKLLELEKENKRLSRTLQTLSSEQSKLKAQLNKIEKKSLDHSIIIRGIQEQYKETDSMLRESIFTELSGTVTGESYEVRLETCKKMAIRACKRIGRFNRNRARPISVEFVHQEDVEYVVENRSYLSEGVFADYEYSPEVERKRRLLLPILRTAKQMVSYRKYCRLEGDELVIHGRHYTIHTLHRLPEDLNPFKITTQEDDDTIGFFGAINPFSNFFEVGFKMDGEDYLSSEQYIQSQKAKFFKDRQAYDRIMGCSTPLDCKEEARRIHGFEKKRWDTVAKELCQTGIQAKFEQNPDLMKILLSTGNKRIVESARDKLWGTGFVLGSEECLDSSKWTTRGIMGEILEHVRSIYQPRDIQYPTASFNMGPMRSSLLPPPPHLETCERVVSALTIQSQLPESMDQTASPAPCETNSEAHPSESNVSLPKLPAADTVNTENNHVSTNQENHLNVIPGTPTMVSSCEKPLIDASSVPLPPLPEANMQVQ